MFHTTIAIAFPRTHCCQRHSRSVEQRDQTSKEEKTSQHLAAAARVAGCPLRPIGNAPSQQEGSIPRPGHSTHRARRTTTDYSWQGGRYSGNCVWFLGWFIIKRLAKQAGRTGRDSLFGPRARKTPPEYGRPISQLSPEGDEKTWDQTKALASAESPHVAGFQTPPRRGALSRSAWSVRRGENRRSSG